MHIAVFQVLHPTNPRATERLGRQYVLAYQELVLKVLRSGPHRVPSLHEETFETPQAVLQNLTQKITRRFYTGYVLVWWSEGFPLLQWIRDQEYPIEHQTVLPPGIQLDLPFEEQEHQEASIRLH